MFLLYSRERSSTWSSPSYCFVRVGRIIIYNSSRTGTDRTWTLNKILLPVSARSDVETKVRRPHRGHQAFINGGVPRLSGWGNADHVSPPSGRLHAGPAAILRNAADACTPSHNGNASATIILITPRTRDNTADTYRARSLRRRARDFTRRPIN